jgi:hypothetical protein
MTISFGTPAQSTNVDFGTRTPTSDICLPKWVTKTIGVVGVDAGDIHDSHRNRSKKQCGSVSLMECVLEACDIDTCVEYAHGQPKWENDMVDGYHSLTKNKTWELAPGL